MAGQRVAVGGKGGIEFAPVVLAQHALGQRQHLVLLDLHVGEEGVRVVAHRPLERFAAGFAHHFEAEQRMLQIADRAFAVLVIVVEPVEHRIGFVGSRTQLRKEQLRLLRVVQPFGKLVDVEQHRPQHAEVGQRAAPAVLGQQQSHRPQHHRQGLMLLMDDAQRFVGHRTTP
jgi:hypothetical protein